MTAKTPTRTAVTTRGYYGHEIIPHDLEHPAELEGVSEEVRAAAVHVDAMVAAADQAARELEGAQEADRRAAAHASPGELPKPTEPALRAAVKLAREQADAANDALRLAVLRQRRAITPDLAKRWRAGHDDRVRQAAETIQGLCGQLVDALAAFESVVMLDQALEGVEHGEGWVLRSAAPGHHQRAAAKRFEQMVTSWRNLGMTPDVIPNEPEMLVAALAANAEMWATRRDRELVHARRGQIAAEVDALDGLSSFERHAELRRRLDAEGIAA